MRFPRSLPVVVALFALLLACSTPPSAPVDSPSAQDASTPATPLDTALPAAPEAAGCDVNALSTRDKLAQLLVVGVDSIEDARAVVTDQHVGGIFYASWTDPSLLGEPLRQIADESPGPLALSVSVDEEGGRVSRLAERIGDQLSPRELAASGMSVDDVYLMALERGREMGKLGFTVDFAPVVDVTDAPDDTVIGDRSFGADPQTVIDYAGAYARGLRDAGLLPVLKHFPGHGSASGDSHAGGVQTPPLPDLVSNDLVPYAALIPQGRTAVMVGHMVVPELTGEQQASLSGPAYDLLRSGVGYGGPPFGGVVFTDDLSSMLAISNDYTVEQAVLMALQAGADVGLFVSTSQVPTVLDRLEAAVNSGELSLEDVTAKLSRWAVEKGPHRRCGG
ncbi:MAG: glycoside hydrolase family 3 N-terminal domain-containing protein [Mycobacterium sp.]